MAKKKRVAAVRKSPWSQLKPGPANRTELSPIAFLPRAAEIYPQRIAVVHGRQRISYAQFFERARRLASALARRGVKRGDVVSAMLPNVPAMLDAHYGVPMLGAVLNTINTRLDADTVAYILEHGEAKVFITDRVFAGVVGPALARLKKKPLVVDVDDPLYTGPGERLGEIEYEKFIAGGDPGFAWSLPRSEDEPIALNYTSGTTGRPKGVVYHHRGTFLESLGNIVAWPVPAHPVYLWTLPMFHCNGWCYPWSVVAMAGTHVCLRAVDPAQVFPMIVEHGVTHMCGAPTVLSMLIGAPEEQRRKFAQPVHIMTGGSPPPAKVIKGMEELGFKVLHIYGMTELQGPSTYCATQDAWSGLALEERAVEMARQGVRYQVVEGRNRTFFFGSYQRWTDRQLGSGFTLNGAPTEAGRAVLQAAAGSRPQVQALLEHLPAAQAPTGQSARFTLGGQEFVVPLGSLTGSSDIVFDNNQAAARIDHQLTSNHLLSGRYLLTHTPENSGTGQVTPPGLTTLVTSNQHSINMWLNSVFGQNMSNEARFAWSHLGTNTGAQDPTSEEIPSIEISELGMTGFNAGANRTAIGLAVNLPQFRYNDTYQFQNNLTYLRGTHAFKAGFDVRYQYVKSFFFPTIRGLLRYPTLQRFVDDVAEAANINKPLPGGEEVNYYRWWDQYYYVQDEWRVRPSFTLNLGLRYELPGNNIQSLIDLNQGIIDANGGNPVFELTPKPKTDKNNFQPRIGFNWSPRTDTSGLVGLLTGGDKFVLRGGYARTNDYAFLNIALNIVSSFPYVAAINRSGLANAFTVLQTTPPGVPAGTNPNLLTRTVVAEDFRSPQADQFSLEIQRQLAQNLAFRIGYVGTIGSDLFQTLDGNPRQPFTGSSGPRVDPTRGVIRLRANTAESWYHSLQTGLDRRFSGGLSAGLHYTWSKYLDTASEIFNPSSGEVAVSQDSFDIKADKAVSSYDRPHRLTGNFVWELPWMRDQQGVIGKVLGGWQFSSFFTFQSGAPFTVLNGSDPTGALAGIDGLVGNAIRPNINSTLELSKMTVAEILAAGGASLFSRLCGGAASAPNCTERVGNVGRNTLRADGIGNVDLGFMKNTRFANNHNIQFRIEMFNATNTRNFGIPEGRVNSSNFLNQWGTDGGNRRIWLALRYVF